MKYYIVDAFSSTPFGGNPAGVVLTGGDSFPEEELMLRIAAELRYSETAFVMPMAADEYTIRYFTPKAEVDLCGHATIASFYLLHRKGYASGRCVNHTLAGDLAVEAGERVMMQMASPRIVAEIQDPGEIYNALGLPGYRPPMPVRIVDAGLSDIIIPVADPAMLDSLMPDMEAVARLTAKHSAVSFHLFAFGGDDYTAHVRDFAPLYGIPEESATGTANAALAYYLHREGIVAEGHECTFLQGEAMGRPSMIAAKLTADGALYVGGTAAIVAEGELLI